MQEKSFTVFRNPAADSAAQKFVVKNLSIGTTTRREKKVADLFPAVFFPVKNAE